MTRSMMKPLRRTVMLVAAAAALVLPRVAEAQQPTTLRVAAFADLRNVDPLISTDNQTLGHALLVYDQLFALDAKGEPRPQMVAAHEASADGLSHVFRLRAGLRWHDGQPVTAADCVASIRRWMAKDAQGVALRAATETLEAIDATSFRWVLKEQLGSLPLALAKIAAYPVFMMPERLASTPADKPITEVIGSGPFRFAAGEWKPGARWLYERFADYAPRSDAPDLFAGNRAANVARIEMLYMPDEATRVAALRAGEIDMAEQIGPDIAIAIESDPNLVVAPKVAAGQTVILRFNHLHPPFNDKRARKAVQMVVDQSEFMTAIAGDKRFWSTCASMFYCGSPFESLQGANKLKGAPDMARARALLQEAGYKGERVTILQPVDNPVSAVALLTAQKLRQLGMTVDLQAMDFSATVQRRANRNPPAEGGWSIIFTRWEGALQSPSIFSPVIGTCERAWFGWPCNPEMERLRASWVKEPDAARRRATLDALHEVVAEELPYLNLGQMVTPMAYRKSLKGVPTTPIMYFWTISK